MAMEQTNHPGGPAAQACQMFVNPVLDGCADPDVIFMRGSITFMLPIRI